MLYDVLFLIFFLLWTFCAAVTTQGFLRLGKTRMRELIAAHPRRFFYAQLHAWTLRDPEYTLLVSASHIVENWGRFGYVVALMYSVFLHRPLLWPWALLDCALGFLVLLCTTEVLTRFWVFYKPGHAVRTLAPLCSFLSTLTLIVNWPFLKLIQWAQNTLGRTRVIDPIEEMQEDILKILRNIQVQGHLDLSDKKLIEAVIRFKDRIVREVMVPRIDLFSLPEDTTIRDAARRLVVEGYSRTPVYKETIDNIVGVLMFKDILEIYMDVLEGKKEKESLNVPISTILKRVFYVPEIKKASHLLQEFRVKQMHMAIVIDEYGGTEGVATMEDILEEIVGEIADEYDIEQSLLYTPLSTEGSWIVDARMSIFDAEEIFGIHIPQEGEYDTLGGYVFYKSGTIPAKGSRVTHEFFDLEVLSASSRNVEKLRLTLKPGK